MRARQLQQAGQLAARTAVSTRHRRTATRADPLLLGASPPIQQARPHSSSRSGWTPHGRPAPLDFSSRLFDASGGASGSRMDREEPRPLSVSGWGGGASSRHRPGQAKPTTRRVADRERMNPPGEGWRVRANAGDGEHQESRPTRAVSISHSPLTEMGKRPPADSNDDSNSSSHRLTSATGHSA